MKRTVIEIEYQREGETESWAWIDDQNRGEPIVTYRIFPPRRKRVAPCALHRTVTFLNHRCWGRVTEGVAMPTRLFLPPAKILRTRELTIEYGKWVELP